MRNRNLLSALFLLAGIAPGFANAGMTLSRAIVTFLPGEPSRQDIVVHNPDQETLYIKVEVSQITDPGTDHEKRVVAKEAEDMDLLVSPNKMVLPPGTEKVVRLVNLKTGGDRERVYRVLLTPIVGNIQSEVPLAIKVVVAYDTLVIVEPKQPKASLTGTRDGKHITFTNTGNVYAFLLDGKQCPADDVPDSSCTELQGTRIYPGSTWSIDLPYDRPVDFTVESLQKNERRHFD